MLNLFICNNEFRRYESAIVGRRDYLLYHEPIGDPPESCGTVEGVSTRMNELTRERERGGLGGG